MQSVYNDYVGLKVSENPQLYRVLRRFLTVGPRTTEGCSTV